MKTPFTLAMAWREGRSSRRRVGLYMGSVSLGVAAVVAINSFGENVSASISEQSRALLGADLELRRREPFPPVIDSLMDSLAAEGVPTSRVTSFGSMVLAPRTELTRLFEIRAVSGGFPYYGTIVTDPPGLWFAFRDAPRVLVDPAVLIHLDVGVGDTLLIGRAEFTVAGVVSNLPGDVGLRSAIGPRVFLPDRYLEETGLLQRGARVRYRTYLQLSDNKTLQGFINGHNALFEKYRIGFDTVGEEEEDLTRELGALAKYLGLVGLIALLLGGMGVASAVHVFAKEKLDTAAVLRCLGANAGAVLAVYLLQAAALGLLGAAVGVVLGLIVQRVLPAIVGEFLPLEVAVSIDWPTVVAGLAIGVWVAVLFALLPLLSLRNVTPLRALRHEAGGDRDRRDPWRIAAYGALAVGIVLLSLWQAPSRPIAFWFAAAIAATGGLLWLTAVALMKATRRYFPRRARYVVRQGIANLFRPQNQTVAVILAIGFGVFLIATLYVVQRNLLAQFALDERPDRPNLVVFDIQNDQRDGALRVMRERGLSASDITPIVSARISHVNGRTVEEILAGPGVRGRWAFRREYRNTYRDSLVDSEAMVAGAWWDEARRGRGPYTATPGEAGSAASRPALISIEEDVAEELGVGLGDRITWDVQGVRIESEIVSIRSVVWARFQPNFFVVFEPGVLERAPQMFVIMTRADDVTTRAEAQRDLVRAYPNISALDLTIVQQSLDQILSKVSLAIRFMALFSIASGIIILIGALTTSRLQRIKEAVLLKTIGAGSRQIRQIMLVEYLAWGSLAALTGVLLAGVAGWAVTRFVFDLSFELPSAQLAGVWVGVSLLTVAIGFASSGEVLRRTPLAVLREMSE